MIDKTISHYKILSELGRGGMGVAYKAEDTKLERTVALKFLAPHLLEDEEGRARFIREAKAAASLDHQNICTVHEIDEVEGETFIAMAFIEGQTVKDKIAERPLKLDEALDIAIQAAQGLKAAHQKEIVHRDIKPANLMLTEEGQLKVMDFGLAQLAEQSRLTKTATMLGTPAYMSPEQTQRLPTDRRSDIWSLGVVIYEMVTGRLPFEGERQEAVLYAISSEEAEPITALRAGLPMELEWIVGKAMAKEAAERYQHVEELIVDLRGLVKKSASAKSTIPRAGPAIGDAVVRLPAVLRSQASPRTARPPWQRRIGWGLAGLCLGVVLTLLVTRPTFKLGGPSTEMIERPFTSDPGGEGQPMFSPDGSAVAYSAWKKTANSPQSDLFVKLLGSEATLQLTHGGNQASSLGPSWSPDGKWIAFLRGEGSSADLLASKRWPIMLIPRIGGVERKLVETFQLRYPDRILAWLPNSKWVITTDKEKPEDPFHLVLLGVETGEKRKLSSPPVDTFGDSGPAVSPDGRRLVFTRHREWGVSDLYSVDLTGSFEFTGEPRLLTPDVPNANCATWTPDGKEIIFCSDVFHASTMWRMSSDGAVAAKPLPFGGRGAYHPSISRTGDKLVYMKHTWQTNIWRVEIPRPGLPASKPLKLISSNQLDLNPAYSPDGEWIAFVSERTGEPQVWLSDRDGKQWRRLTSMNSNQRSRMRPRWSPDGA